MSDYIIHGVPKREGYYESLGNTLSYCGLDKEGIYKDAGWMPNRGRVPFLVTCPQCLAVLDRKQLSLLEV